jgi:hypothetical protein
MRYLFFILLPVLLFSQKYDPQKIEHGKRGNEYRVWIYFTDKDGAEPILIPPFSMLNFLWIVFLRE